MRSFADIPATVERLLAGGERTAVGVVLLDAFGRRFLERHADHPFLRRLEITPIATQFPPTTTAHVTTMHTGRPVGEHGLYEWNVYEPSLDEVVIPLRSDDARCFLDGETLYERLPVPSTVLQPASFSPSPYDRVFAAGARLQPFATFELGVRRFADALAAGGYAYLYWDRIDAAGHRHGPDSPQFQAAAVQALDALEAGLPAVPGALVLVTADHGQVPVDPARVDFLDELWPELPRLLTQRPAGSSRDVFLHTVPGAADEVAAGLAERLGERAEVRPAAGLFASVGPRLRQRLGDVCVLPAAGRTAWLRSAPNVAAAFRGHHGGLHPDETETWVGALYS
ncbi:MAG TPA: alkaline phosphatase family protein [Solirubrobacteraceae bacterium]|nr:alkaline phosphatase family protein [Solirubrobacteraceae bacterium]